MLARIADHTARFDQEPEQAAAAVEQGLLRWDDRPGVVLGLANDEVHEGLRDVTLLHLLSHRAGIGAYDIDW